MLHYLIVSIAGQYARINEECTDEMIEPYTLVKPTPRDWFRISVTEDTHITQSTLLQRVSEWPILCEKNGEPTPLDIVWDMYICDWFVEYVLENPTSNSDYESHEWLRGEL